MSKKIIMADPDLQYLLKLQLKFLQKLQDSFEIEAISDINFYDKYLSKPQSAVCLIVNEEWASVDLLRHDIEKIVILTGGQKSISAKALEENSLKIAKHTSTEEIYNKVRSMIGDEFRPVKSKQSSSVIMFRSASGGTGKTVLAMSLAEYLASKYYKVLYVNTQTVQTFQYYLLNQSPISNGTAIALQSRENNVYDTLKSQTREEHFEYLPPFAMLLYSYNIRRDVFTRFIREAKASKEYDYIIVDGDSDLDSSAAEQIALADKVFMILRPGEEYEFALNQLLKKISIPADKLIKVCNKVKRDNKRATSANEYIADWEREIDAKTIKEFAQTTDIKKMALLVE